MIIEGKNFHFGGCLSLHKIWIPKFKGKWPLILKILIFELTNAFLFGWGFQKGTSWCYWPHFSIRGCWRPRGFRGQSQHDAPFRKCQTKCNSLLKSNIRYVIFIKIYFDNMGFMMKFFYHQKVPLKFFFSSGMHSDKVSVMSPLCFKHFWT